MIQLPNNCSRSEFHVFPSNWKTTKAKISDIWYADCRFTDSTLLQRYPRGKVIRIKAGINRLKTVPERRYVITRLIKEMEEMLERGYNPITTTEIDPYVTTNHENDKPLKKVDEHSPFIPALRFALSKSTSVKETKADVKSVLNSFETAARSLDFAHLAIGDVQVKHVKLILDECLVLSSMFSAKRFNKAKAYLSGLFKFLIQVGAASGNMAIAVSPMKEKATRRMLLKDDEIERIKAHLHTYHRPFYKFMMIFYFSGGRLKELFRLQGKDVDLNGQTYETLVLKGKKERYVKRTIRDTALSFWVEQMKDCGPLDYVFSNELLPGSVQINSKQITRRWMTHVKKPLGIEATFYKLKHVNTDRTTKALGAKIAAGQNAHTTTKMVEEVYAYNEQQRIHDSLKSLDIEL